MCVAKFSPARKNRKKANESARKLKIGARVRVGPVDDGREILCTAAAKQVRPCSVGRRTGGK